MKRLRSAWGFVLLLCVGMSAAAQAAQWQNTLGTTVITGDQVRLVGSASIRAKADVLNIAVVAGQSYTLNAQVRSSVAGNWTYVGLVNGGTITEQGASSSTYTAIAPISFTATGSTVSVYASFWQGQTGDGYVQAVTLNGTAVISGASSSTASSSLFSVASSAVSSSVSSAVLGGYTWVNASGPTSVNGDLITLTASNIVARGEIRNVAVTAGQSYSLTGNVYNSAAGSTYIGVVNGSQTIEAGGNWATSTAITPIIFTAQGSTVTIYGSFWKDQAGNGYAHNVKLNGAALIGGSVASSTASSVTSSTTSSSSKASSLASSVFSSNSSAVSSIASSAASSATSSSAGSGPCAGSYILCDDFSAATIDTTKWVVANEKIANKYRVGSENIALTTVNDNGTDITVVDSMAFGKLHGTGVHQGGILKSKNLLGGGRYEVRMKNLPGPNGCSCIWNYYDSENEAIPPATRIYTEIDIEMPAHEGTAPAWATWKKILGLNTWSHTDADADATYINYPSTTVNPFDGQFHVYRFDWYDSNNGNLRIDWYVDNILQATTTQHVSDHPAILWVGNWPAPWSGMDYNFDTLHMYIDWIRVSEL